MATEELTTPGFEEFYLDDVDQAIREVHYAFVSAKEDKKRGGEKRLMADVQGWHLNRKAKHAKAQEAWRALQTGIKAARSNPRYKLVKKRLRDFNAALRRGREIQVIEKKGSLMRALNKAGMIADPWRWAS